MPFIPVADTVEVELFQMLHGQKIENTQYWRKIGGSSVADATDLWNSLLIWWSTSFSIQLSNQLTLLGAKITDLSSETSYAVEFAAPAPHPAGHSVSFGLPGNVALVASFRTNSRGRSYRGRNFVAGLPEDGVDGNTVQTSVVNALQASYAALLSDFAPSGWEWVVASRFHNKLPRVAGIATAITSVIVVDPYIDSQRRRLTGRGT